MSQKQKTIAREIKISGVGLHTGRQVSLTFKPAPVDNGYTFVRTDLEGRPTVEADPNLVCSTSRGTTLEKRGVKVHTTEHTLAAAYGCDIDNLIIEMDAPEPPIMDGSAKYFIEALQEAGVVEQDAPRREYVIKDIITYSDPATGSEIIAMPADDFQITTMVDFGTKVLGTQNASIKDISQFREEIAPARTFCFLHELEQLLDNGLIKGGDLTNAIVYVDKEISETTMNHLKAVFNRDTVSVKPNGVLDNLTLHYPNEAARHKLLDVMGDIALVGRRIRGKIIANKPGHFTNTQFAKKLAKIIHAEERSMIPKFDIYQKPLMDINEIMNVLNHRPPFLLIDKILELSDTNVIGLKNVTMNEPFFVGHFPGAPVMPGVLQIEAMAQCGGILALRSVPDPENYLTFFMKIESAKFKTQVNPGDTLVFSLKLVAPIRRGICHMEGIIYANNKIVCEAELMAMLKRKDDAPTL